MDVKPYTVVIANYYGEERRWLHIWMSDPVTWRGMLDTIFTQFPDFLDPKSEDALRRPETFGIDFFIEGHVSPSWVATDDTIYPIDTYS